MKKKLIALVMTASAVLATPAFAGIDGEWRCKASGDIPIAIVTISGSSYDYQAVRNTAWAPKNDPANGSGEFDIQGDKLYPTSGPLADIFGAVGSYCDENTGCAYEYLALDSTKHIPLGCWRAY
mgnify:CR=1|jgi:hypothetical protein